MTKVFYPALLCIILSIPVQAQKEINNPLVNSKDVIAKGVALHDEGKYKEAINEYLKVPASDTGYSDILHEMILSYYNDSNFSAAEKYVRQAQTMFPERNPEWYAFLADIYDDSKRTEQALPLYDSILTQNPYSYLSYFNKGITLMRLSRMEEAETNFQRCIILNPYYSSAHHFLGRLCLIKGNLTQALLSFTTSLLVSPESRYLKTTVSYLSSIAEINNTVEESLKKYKPTKEDDFEMVQEIIVSKIALDKKYKLKTDLEDNIVRQLQVTMEKLEYNANDKGFWMQYYVPLYKQLWEKDRFEPFIFYIFSELDIKRVKEYVKKDKKKVEAASDEAITYLNVIRETQELNYPQREKNETKYYIQNYKVSGKGAFTLNSKNEKLLTGPWEFYYTSNGRLKSKGTFDTEGLRQGEWRYYYENGIQKEISFYKNDKVTGKTSIWFDNGILYRTLTYEADEKNGEETTWFYNGKLNSVIHYKADKKEGVAKYYNVKGYLKTVANYTNDLQEGEEIAYHENGTKESIAKYTNDLPTAEYNEYFDNGKLKINGVFAEGKKTGVWKRYHVNDKQESLENYIKGELEGEYTAWYSNGKIETKRVYRKGEIDGKSEDYDDDGVLSGETVFEKGRLRDIKFFDKAANVISNTSSRKGSADILFYAPDGSKSSDGFYSKEGLLEGKSNTYYKNGTVSIEGNYKNGELDGKRLIYYENGKLKQEGNYTAGEADGYFVDYYVNGEVMEEGWYVEDERQGTVISRNLFGQIISKLYYLDNNIHGITEYYFPTGGTDYKMYYDNGWFNRIEQFDSTGNLISNSALDNGDGVIQFKHFNGNPYVENNYKNYKQHGPYKILNGDGSKYCTGFYKNGEKDSLYTEWHPNGKLAAEGSYFNNSKTGTWKTYWNNGQLSSVENYTDGKLEGKTFQYNEDGSIDKELNYADGLPEGEFKTYADKQLALVYYYKKGVLTGYSYEDKTGKLLPLIPIVKGTGKVTGYFKNGAKSIELEFKEYLVDGLRTLYYPNGKEYVSGIRVNGLENGIKKIFYPSGKIMKEENYVYGSLHGHVKFYNENSTLVSDLNYYLGNLHGESNYYTAGKLATTFIYYYGALESKK